MLSNVTGSPVRSCKVPEVMIVSPMFRPCNTCTSASVRMPVVISTGCAFPDYKEIYLPFPTMASEVRQVRFVFRPIQLDTGITAGSTALLALG